MKNKPERALTEVGADVSKGHNRRSAFFKVLSGTCIMLVLFLLPINSALADEGDDPPEQDETVTELQSDTEDTTISSEDDPFAEQDSEADAQDTETDAQDDGENETDGDDTPADLGVAVEGAPENQDNTDGGESTGTENPVYGAYFLVDGIKRTFAPGGSRDAIRQAIDAADGISIDGNTIYVDGGSYAALGGDLSGYTLRASGENGVPHIGGLVLAETSGFELIGFTVDGDIEITNSTHIYIEGTTGDDVLNVALGGTISDITIDGGDGGDSIHLSGDASSDDVTVTPDAADEVTDNTEGEEADAGEDDIVDESGQTDDAGDADEQGMAENLMDIIRNILIYGGSGDDHLFVHFDTGNPIPAGGASFDGGDGYDDIVISGGEIGSAVYTAVDESSGTIVLDGGMLAYTNIEPITDSTAGDKLIEGTAGDDVIDIVNGAAAGSIEVKSAQFENITFTNKVNVIINGADGDDIFHMNLTSPSTGLASLAVAGGAGADRIDLVSTLVNLPGVDLSLDAETITINDSTIHAKDISITAQDAYDGLNPFRDMVTTIDIDNAHITATGSLTILASSTQQNPVIDNGLIELRDTNALITITDSTLSAGSAIGIMAAVLLALEVNGFLPALPLDITVISAGAKASVIVDGTTSLIAGGDVQLMADASLDVSSLSKSVGPGGAVTFSLAIVSSTAQALLQGSADIGAEGTVTIKAQNLLSLTSVSDGFAIDEGVPAGVGAAIAITVADINTKAGIYENATISDCAALEIDAWSSATTGTTAETSAGGATDPISDALHVQDGGDDVMSDTLMDEINAFIDNIMGGIIDASAGEEGGSAVQVAGAFTYSDVESACEASITTTGLVSSRGVLTINSKAVTNASSVASGMTSGGTVGVGAGIAVLDASNTNAAYIGDNVRVHAHGVNINALSEDFRADVDDTENDFTAEAYAGQGADTVGICGTLAVNVVLSDTAAYIGKNAQVVLDGGDVNIQATNNTNVKTVASGAPDEEDEAAIDSFFALFTGGGEGGEGGEEEEGPQVGVGASIAITISTVKTLAYIDDNASVTGAHDMSLSASADTSANTESVAGVEGGVAVSPVLALTVSAVQTEAFAGTGNTMTLSGGFSAQANHNGSTDSSSSGKTAGSDVGIGAAVTINVVMERTRATTKRAINARGTVKIRTQAATSVNGRSEAGATGGDGEDEEEDGDGDGEDGDPDTGGIDEMLNSLLDYFGTVAEDNGAEDQGAAKSNPESAETSEGKLNVAGALTLNIVTSLSEACIPAGVSVVTTGDIEIFASGNTDSEAVADASATESAVGIGAAVAINVVTAQTLAYIGEGATVSAAGLCIEAAMTVVTPEAEDEEEPEPETENTYAAEATSGAGAGNVGLAGAAAINVVTSQAKAYSNGTVTLTGDASICAASETSSSATAGTTVAGEGEDAKVGVGASFALNTITNNILAYIGDNASLNGAVDLLISADFQFSTDTTATAGADPFSDLLGEEPAEGAKFSLDAAVALTTVTNNVKAYTGAASTISASGSGTLSASTQSATVTRSEGNANGSKAAVGASVALNIINATTEASISGDATFGGALSITAESANTDDVSALATARGLKLERYLNKYKTTIDSILNGDFGDDTTEKPKSAQTLQGQGASTPQTTNQSGGSGQSGQSISVAAAVGVNVTTHKTLAFTQTGTISVGGAISISATSSSNFETLGTGAAVTDGNSIAVGVAVSNIYNETISHMGSADANGNNISIMATSSQNMADAYLSKLGSQGIAGAVSGTDGKIGVAGALALIVSHAKTKAYINPNAQVIDAGAITITAQETSKLAVRAWAATVVINGQSAAGIGATFAVIYANNEILAYIGAGANVSAVSVAINAEKKRVNITDFSYDFDFDNNTIPANIFEGIELINFLTCNNYYAEAIAGAASAGTMAFAGAFVVVIFGNTTSAYIDDTAVVNTTGGLTINAKSDVNAKAIGGSAAAAQKAGIGLTTVNVINNDHVNAYIGAAAVTSGGNIVIDADAKQEFTVIAVSGSGASTAGIAGVLSVVVSQNSCNAYIGDSATVKTAGSLSVTADNDSYVFIIAGGGTGGGTAGVGGSVAVLIMLNHTDAYIGAASVDASGKITISADAYLLNVTAVISGSGGGTAGIAASLAVKTIESTTRAYIDAGATVNADAAYAAPGQALEITADDTTILAGVSGSGSGGGTVGVGASNNTDVLLKHVKAYIGDGAHVSASGNIIIEAHSDETVVSITAGFSGGGSVGVGGAVGVFVTTNDIAAYIDSHAVVITNGSVAVSATDDLVLVMLVGSGAGGGSVGVGGAIAVATVINTVKAYIGDSAKVTALGGGGGAVSFYTGGTGKAKSDAHGVLVGAYESEDIIVIVVSGSGGGSAGVAASVSTVVIDNDTYAYIDNNAKINEVNTAGNALQEVRVIAVDETDLVTTVGSGSGGGAAGVGASSDTGVMSKDTRAYIGFGTLVNAKKDIAIIGTAREVHVSTTAGFAGGGSAGVAGALSVSVIDNTTQAYTSAPLLDAQSGAALNAGGNLTVKAADYVTMVLTAGSGAGGGAAGVGASFAVAVLSSTTKAFLGGKTVSNASGITDIFADTSENIISTVVGGAGGGAAGVAGSIGVKVIGTTTQSYIGADVRVNQDMSYSASGQCVRVRASDQIVEVGISGTGAGGGAAGVSASSDVAIIRNTVSAYIGERAKVYAKKDVDVLADSDRYINSLVVTGSGGGAAGVAGAVSVIVIGAAFDSYASGSLKNSEGEGDTQSALDGQMSDSSVGDFLGSSSQSADAKATVDGKTSGIGISSYFDEASGAALSHTQAFISANAEVNAGEDITVRANDMTLSITASVAGSGGGAAGVAGVINVVVVHDSAEAFIGAGAKTNAKGTTTVEATTSDNIYDMGITGSGAGAAAVNGVVKVDVVNTETQAYIAQNAWVNQDAAYHTAAQSVIVQAVADSYIVAVGGSGGGAGAAAVGGVVNIVVFGKHTMAAIGSGARVSAMKNIIVSAESEELLVGVSISIFGAGAAAVSGVVGTFVFTNLTEAYIGANAFVDSDGNVKVSAADDTFLISVVAVGNGAGAAAVGAAVNVNTLTNTTKAYILDGATVNARGNAEGISVYTGELGAAGELPAGAWDEDRGIDIDGDGVSDVQAVNKTPDVNRDGTSDGNLNGGVDFTVSSEDGEGGSDADKNVAIDNSGLGVRLTETVKGLSVIAVSNQKVITTTVAIAGAGAAGVTGADSNNILTSSTEAYIQNAIVNQDNSDAGAQQSVRVGAFSSAFIVQTEMSIGIAGAAGVSGSFNIAVVENTTKAYAGGAINARTDIVVTASSTEDVEIATANVSGGGAAGVGGAAGAAQISGGTYAYILKNSDLSAGADIAVIATNDAAIRVDTLSGAGGGAAGVGGAVCVQIVSQTTKAYVEDAVSASTGASLYAAGDILIKALSSEDLGGIAVSGAGGGAAGIAGAVVIRILSTTTQAYIGAYANVNQNNDDTLNENQSVTVWAKDTVIAETDMGAGSVSGVAGVGAAVDVNVIRSTVTAYIGAYANVDAERNSGAATPLGHVVVKAEADRDITSTVIAASGGYTLGIGAAVSIINIGAMLDSDSQSSLGSAASFADGEISGDHVSGQLGGSEHTSGTETAVSSKVSGISVSSYLDATSANSLNKTRAYIGAYANVAAQGNISVAATDTVSLSQISGGVAIGAVGVGGGVAITTLKSTTEAFVDNHAQLYADGDILIDAQSVTRDGEKISILGIGGGAGLVGIGAAVAYLDVANITRAYLGSYVAVTGADALTVTASNNIEIKAMAVGASIGAGAVGGSFARAKNTSLVEAYLSDHVTVSETGVMILTAVSRGDVDADAIAGAAGIISGQGAFALANYAPTVNCYVGNASDIDVTGDIALTAQSIADVDARADGVSVGALTIGVSYADAKLSPNVNAYFGTGVSAGSENISIMALHNYSTAGSKLNKDVSAHAFAAAGALVGGSGADANAYQNATVKVYIGAGADIDANQDIMLWAYGNLDADADADGITLGFAGVGAVFADATVTGTLRGYIDSTTANPSSVVAGGTLAILVLGYATPSATSEQAAGGIVAGGGSDAGAAATLNVKAYLGTTGGEFHAGSISMTARAQGSANANADGFNAGGISVGASIADASWTAVVITQIGTSTHLVSDGSIIFAAREECSNVNAYASSSTGALVGGAGSRASAAASADVQMNIGASAVIEAAQYITIESQSDNETMAEATGYAYGLAAGGTTNAVNSITNTTLTQIGAGAHITAGSNININALSNSAANRCKATGGVGGFVGGASTSADVDITNTTRVTLGANVVTDADNTNQMLARSSVNANGWSKIDTGGVVTFNQTKSDVDVTSLTQVDIGSGSVIRGKFTNIYAKVIKLDIDSYAYSKTYAADSHTEAVSDVDVISNAKIIIYSADIHGASKLTISAKQENVCTNSEAYAEIGAGVLGSVISTGANDLTAYSHVDIRTGSSLYGDDILIEAISPQDIQDTYIKDATALARTVVEYVTVAVEKFITVVEKVVEKICKWMPWPLNKIIKWVTKTVTKIVRTIVYVLKELILDSEVEATTPGSYSSSNRVDLNADVYLGNAAGVSMTIRPDYTIETNGSITGSIVGGKVVVDDFMNQQLGALTINSPSGAVSGDCVMHKNAIITLFEITNESDLDMSVGSISLVNEDDATPQFEVISEDILTDVVFTYTTDVTDTPTVNIVATQDTDITLTGSINNTTGIVTVETQGGNIYALPGAMIAANNLSLRAPSGNIGTDGSRIVAYLFKGSDINAQISLEAGGNAYIDLISSEYRQIEDVTGSIDGLQIVSITVGGDCDIYAPQPQLYVINDAGDALAQIPVHSIFDFGSIDIGGDFDFTAVDGSVVLDGGLEAENVRINVSGSVEDSDDAGATDISASTVDIIAGTNVGTQSNPIEIDLRNQQLINADSGGGVYIREVSGPVFVGKIVAIGDVILTAEGHLFNKAGMAGANITGRNITLVSDNGGIGTSSDPMETDLTGGVLLATAVGDVYITEMAGDMNLGSVVTSGDAYLTADGSILAATAGVHAEAGHITLTAQNGSIGTDIAWLVVDTSLMISANAADNIYIREYTGDMNVSAHADAGVVFLEADGDINIDDITAGGNADITSGGSINDAMNADAANITAENITLSAGGGIGEMANRLEIDAGASGMLNAVAVGSIYIRELLGNMNAEEITSDASIYLEAMAGDVNIKHVTAGGDADITASESIKDSLANTDANIFAVNIRLRASGGGIGTAANPLEIDAGALGTFTAFAQDSIYIVENTGDMNVASVIAQTGGAALTAVSGDVNIVVIAVCGNADITASGVVTDAAVGSDTNIIAADIKINAQGGSIGAKTNPVRIETTGSLTATAQGGIFITANNGDVNAYLIEARAGDVCLAALNGDINVYVITASGDACVAASGSVYRAAGSAEPNITAVNITLDAQHGDIGEADDALKINLDAAGILNAYAKRHIYVTETTGLLTIGVVKAQTGDAELEAPTGDIALGKVFAGNTARLVAYGSIYDVAANDNANVIATHINMEAENGDIGAQVNWLEIDAGAAGTLSAWAKGSLYIIENGGDMTIVSATARTGDAYLTAKTGSMKLGTVNAGNDALLTAQGSIVNTTGTAVNVICSNLVMTAKTGHIGGAGAFVFINTAASGDGVVLISAENDIFIRETAGNLNVFKIISIAGDVSVAVDAGSLIDANQNDGSDDAAIRALNALSGGAGAYKSKDLYALVASLKDITDTDYMTETPNIEADNMTISVSQSVGRYDWIRIDFAAGTATLTGDMLLAIAASERGDVLFFDARGNRLASGANAAYMLVRVYSDIDILATGAVTIDAGDDIFLGSQKDINVNTVKAQNTVMLRSDGGLKNAAGKDAVNVSGTDMILGSASAAIGSESKPLTLRMAVAGKLTARALQGIYLSAAGSMGLNFVYCPIFASLSAIGTVSDKNHDTLENVVSHSLDIVAGSVGTQENIVEINLAEDGVLNVTSGSDVFLEEVKGDMNVGVVTSRSGNVTLTADGSITDFYHTNAVNVRGADITLISIGGVIGSEGNDLDVDSSYGGHGNLNAQSPRSMYLRETSGNMNVGALKSGADIYLKAAAGITSGETQSVNIDAKRLYFVAGFVGAEGAALTSAIGVVNGTATGGPVYVKNSGSLRVGLITSPGVVNLETNGQLLNGNGAANNIEAAAFVFTAGNGVGTASAPMRTAVGHLQGTGGSGAVYIRNTGDLRLGFIQTTKDIHLVNSGSIAGDGAKTNVAAAGFYFEAGSFVGKRNDPLHTSVDILEGRADGAVYISDVDDLSIGLVQGTKVYLWSGGHIRNGNASTNVIGSAFWFDAASGIGESGSPVRTQVTNIEGDAGTGSVWITNKGRLVIGGADSETDGISAKGSIHIEAMSPIVVREAISAGDDIVLTANDSVGPGDDITVESNATIESSNGSITLQAGDNISIGQNATLAAAGKLLLVCGYKDVDSEGASVTIDQGTTGAVDLAVEGNEFDNVFNINTNSYANLPITIYGYAGDDVYNITVQGMSATITLDGGEGSDTYHIFANDVSGGVVLNVFDSGKSGEDILDISGTDGSNTFLFRRGYVAVFNGTQSNRSENNLTVAGNSNLESLIVNGLGGEDWYIFDDNFTATTVVSGGGNDHFRVGQLYNEQSTETEMAHMRLGYLSSGISYRTALYGGGGDDIFQIYANDAVLSVYGEEGEDTFIVHPFLIYFEDGERQYHINAHVDIDGGPGFDSIILAKTSLLDFFNITDTTITESGLDIGYINVENVGVKPNIPLSQAFALDGLQQQIGLPFTNLVLLIVLAGVLLVVIGIMIWLLIRRRRRKLASAA